MLGYVQIFKPELKIREYETYSGYYCGVCKYIGSRYGQLPRMVLSYDAAFLACILASVDDTPDEPSTEHCIAHHIKHRTVIRNSAIGYAGDVMLILAWHKLQDDINDEGSKGAKAAQLVFRKTYRRLRSEYPKLCDEIAAGLAELSRLENAHCASLDEAGESFSAIMKSIFRHGAEILYPDVDHLHRTFAEIGYHMGKWIYLMDAADDIEENIESGAYNPLLYRFGYGNDDCFSPESTAFAQETADEFRERIRDRLEFNLYHYLAVISEHAEHLDIKKNKGIIDNIIYFGMNRRTEMVLNGEKKKDKEDIK